MYENLSGVRELEWKVPVDTCTDIPWQNKVIFHTYDQSDRHGAPRVFALNCNLHRLSPYRFVLNDKQYFTNAIPKYLINIKLIRPSLCLLYAIWQGYIEYFPNFHHTNPVKVFARTPPTSWSWCYVTKGLRKVYPLNWLKWRIFRNSIWQNKETQFG